MKKTFLRKVRNTVEDFLNQISRIKTKNVTSVCVLRWSATENEREM